MRVHGLCCVARLDNYVQAMSHLTFEENKDGHNEEQQREKIRIEEIREPKILPFCQQER